MAIRRSSLRKWVGTALLALAAGFTAVGLQPVDAKLARVVVAFLAAALPVIAAPLLHGKPSPLALVEKMPPDLVAK